MMKDENKQPKRESPYSIQIRDNCVGLERGQGSITNLNFYRLAIGLHPLGKKFDAPPPLDNICWTLLEFRKVKEVTGPSSPHTHIK